LNSFKKIEAIAQKLKEEEKELFEDVDINKFMKGILEIIDKNLNELSTLSDDILSYRIRRIMIIEAMSQLLKDFTPEDIKEFELIVRGGKK